jgi:geranylgeranyl reductase family protein
MQHVWDLVVVGAGPAGSQAAHTAAARGLRVLLLDKEEFPRPKTCGGLVSAKACAALGLRLPTALGERRIESVRLVGPDGETAVTRTAPFLGWTVDRAALDAFLVEEAVRAGAEFRPGTAFLSIENAASGHISLRTSRGNIRAYALVGADGSLSSVAGALGQSRGLPAWRTALALSAMLSLPAPRLEEVFNGGRTVNFYCLPLPYAFGWAFPYRERVNLGLGAWSGAGAALPQLMAGFARQLQLSWGITLQAVEVRGAYLPAGGFVFRPGRGRVLLAGDAAGLVDPFSGEGIYFALRSGKLAAETLAGCLGTPGASPNYAPRLYAAACRRELLGELRLALALAILTGTKRRFFRSISAHPERLELLVQIMTNPRAYRAAFFQAQTLGPPTRAG